LGRIFKEEYGYDFEILAPEAKSYLHIPKKIRARRFTALVK
jgi:hypothetical protein